ncbi:MAG TPA: nitrilase-related carbon-nitrogen hydrolase [Castellaniella sp.]|uniref:nitrilase-related carbon-nitrogen hydrolase n=1 Tax=Castellaniella sp. TaxID=1955812 RepID=UPI002EF09642
MAGTSHLRVAVAQTDGMLGDLGYNRGQHLELIKQARDQRAALLLFPELSLTGYQIGRAVPDLACRRDDPLILDLAKAAQGLDVAFGFVEEGPGAQFYNALAIVRDGQVRFVHRKINLPTYGELEEGKLFAAGHRVDTCPIGGPWDAAALICADLWNPALVHLAMLHGATLMLAPISSALGVVDGKFSNPAGWDLALRFYAMMYGTAILMANRLGQEGSRQFWGGSRILGPYGDTLAAVPDGQVGLACADLDYADVRQARFNLPTLRDSDPALVARELNRFLNF